MSCERNGSCHLSCNVLVRRICKAEGSLLLGIGPLYRLLLLFRCHASHRHLEILLAYRLVRRYAPVLARYRDLCRTFLLVPLLRCAPLLAPAQYRRHATHLANSPVLLANPPVLRYATLLAHHRALHSFLVTLVLLLDLAEEGS